MAKTYTEEEYQQELIRALAEGRKPMLDGMDSDEEKRTPSIVISLDSDQSS